MFHVRIRDDELADSVTDIFFELGKRVDKGLDGDCLSRTDVSSQEPQKLEAFDPVFGSVNSHGRASILGMMQAVQHASSGNGAKCQSGYCLLGRFAVIYPACDIFCAVCYFIGQVGVHYCVQIHYSSLLTVTIVIRWLILRTVA